jgi:hypothetical protein
MSIPKMTSKEINDILKSAQSQITTMDAKIDKVKSDVSSKLFVMGYYNEYMAKQLEDLRNGKLFNNTSFKLLSEGTGIFDSFGATVHPTMLKPSPIDVFNLKISNTGDVLFRSDAIVKIDDVQYEPYNTILMHDSITTKEMFFKEFTNSTAKIEVSIDTNNVLGSTKFNVIEIDPFLPGSFDITSIDVYELNDDGTLNNTPVVYDGAINVGKQRLIFGEKKSFYKVVFNVAFKFKSSREGKEVYPFGLKHIYFYDTNFKSDSYIISKINSDDTIYYIKDSVVFSSPSGTAVSTLTAEGIKIYLDYKNNVLSSEIQPSTSSQLYPIVRATKTLYAKIPLGIESLIGVSFELGKNVEIVNATETTTDFVASVQAVKEPEIEIVEEKPTTKHVEFKVVRYPSITVNRDVDSILTATEGIDYILKGVPKTYSYNMEGYAGVLTLSDEAPYIQNIDKSSEALYKNYLDKSYKVGNHAIQGYVIFIYTGEVKKI